MSSKHFNFKIINVRCIEETNHDGWGRDIANDAMRLKAVFLSEDSDAAITERTTSLYDLGSNYQGGTTVSMDLLVGSISIRDNQPYPVGLSVGLFLIEEDYFGDLSGIENAIKGYAKSAKEIHGLLSTIVGFFPGTYTKIASGIGKIASIVEPLIAELILQGGNDLFPPRDVTLLIPEFNAELTPEERRGVVEFQGHGGKYQLTYEWQVQLSRSRSGTVPLNLYWSRDRSDNFSTATNAGINDARASGYRFAKTEGYIFSARRPGTVPLDLFWSDERRDNFSTATEQGRSAAEDAGYHRVRTEGFVFSRQERGTVPLRLYWSEPRSDNFISATDIGRRSAQAAGYRYVRVEGYIYPKAIALRAHNGQFVHALNGGGSSVDANRSWILEHEIFEVDYLRDNRIALRTHNGYYLCAENGGGRELVANRTWIGDWEVFQIILVSGSRIALRVHNGQYVTAEGGGGRELVANRTTIDIWETFELIGV